jgi:hypothetical protein
LTWSCVLIRYCMLGSYWRKIQLGWRCVCHYCLICNVKDARLMEMWNELNSATVLCGRKVAPSSALNRCYIFCCLYVGYSLHKVHEGGGCGGLHVCLLCLHISSLKLGNLFSWNLMLGVYGKAVGWTLFFFISGQFTSSMHPTSYISPEQWYPDYYGRTTKSRRMWIGGAGELYATLYLRNISPLTCTIGKRN